MTEPHDILKQNYDYNTMVVKSLIHLLPISVRQKAQKWIEKIEQTSNDMKYRSEYMWFLLLDLQNGTLTIPFNDSPPLGSLNPLSKILPPNVYQELLSSCLTIGKVDESLDEESDMKAEKNTPPSLFFKSQPKPKHGAYCYACVFSDPGST